jgi:hypothetical protein
MKSREQNIGSQTKECYYVLLVGRDSSVQPVASRYGLDGSGIKSRWGRHFPHLFRAALGPTQPSIQWIPCLLPGDKLAGAWP